MIQEFLTPQTLSTIGFPVAVTFYLLFFFQKKLDENTKAINNLIIFLNGKNKRR